MVLCSTPNGIALARVCRETPRAAAVAADPAAIGGVRLHAEQVMQTGGAAAKLDELQKARRLGEAGVGDLLDASSDEPRDDAEQYWDHELDNNQDYQPVCLRWIRIANL